MTDRVLRVSFRREAHESLPSTNVRAFELARAGDLGNVWVTAEIQTAGRGRRGRAWSTEPGNLAASLLLIDPAPPDIAATVSFPAGLALHQAIVDIAGPTIAERLKLKWPNDLLLDRRKVSGILVEGESVADGRFAVVIGIGVNCSAHPPSSGVYPATDFLEAGIEIPVGALLARLTERMAEELVTWDRGAGFAATRSAWLARSIGFGESVRVNLTDEVFDGRFENLDDAGRLVVLAADGRRRTVSAGDVYFGGRH
jgi:BirA family transcriptional regulator, biotin operon repressor / biotin---[acetyl-CoA-carboxylase] ligase